MDHHSQAPPRAHSQIVLPPSKPKVLVSSPANFSRVAEPKDLQHYYERPMMLNAWTQTSADDFEYLLRDEHLKRKDAQSKTEKELLEKIRVLEENLRAHSEILSQIHATSAQKSALLLQQQTGTQQQQREQQQREQQQYQQSSSLHEPTQANSATRQSSASVSNALINPVQQVPPTDSVKYTIIAEANGDANGEPIEIELAEDDADLHLNSSADSNRLEICLADENIVVKNECTKTEAFSPPASQQLRRDEHTPSSALVKRRKISMESQELTHNSSYYFNNSGVLTAMSDNAPTDPAKQQTPLALRNKNSLLKTPKSESPATPVRQPSNTLGQKMDLDNVMVSIGPNNTRIPAKIYENMSWATPSIATRKLLMAIFDRKTLATHSMTGKPSPAFKDHGKPLKQMLDPLIIQDIIFAVTRKCNVSEKEVRNAITTKCADENKMMKLQMNKNRPLREVNKENVKC